MRDLPWPNRFHGAYCFGNSFSYLDDQGNAQFLKAVSGALKPGARFVLDTGYVLEIILPTLQERAWYPVGEYADAGTTAVTSQSKAACTWSTRGFASGKTEKRSMSARLYSVRELAPALQGDGLCGVATLLVTRSGRVPARLAPAPRGRNQAIMNQTSIEEHLRGPRHQDVDQRPGDLHGAGRLAHAAGGAASDDRGGRVVCLDPRAAGESRRADRRPAQGSRRDGHGGRCLGDHRRHGRLHGSRSSRLRSTNFRIPRGSRTRSSFRRATNAATSRRCCCLVRSWSGSKRTPSWKSRSTRARRCSSS